MDSLKEQRNAAIRSAFNSLNAKKYTLEYRLEKIAKQFFLKPNTIYAIIKARGQYRPADQASQKDS